MILLVILSFFNKGPKTVYLKPKGQNSDNNQASTSDVNKFLTSDFMPVVTDDTISSGAGDGSIDSLIVTAGSGYSPSSGTYYAPIYGDGTGGVA